MKVRAPSAEQTKSTAKKTRKIPIHYVIHCMHFENGEILLYLYALIHIINDAYNAASARFDRRRWGYFSINYWCVSSNSFAAPTLTTRIVPHDWILHTNSIQSLNLLNSSLNRDKIINGGLIKCFRTALFIQILEIKYTVKCCYRADLNQSSSTKYKCKVFTSYNVMFTRRHKITAELIVWFAHDLYKIDKYSTLHHFTVNFV